MNIEEKIGKSLRENGIAFPRSDKEIEKMIKNLTPISSLDDNFIENVVNKIKEKCENIVLNKNEIEQLLSFTISHGVKSPGDVIGKRIVEKFMEKGIVFRDDFENYQLTKLGWRIAKKYLNK